MLGFIKDLARLMLTINFMVQRLREQWYLQVLEVWYFVIWHCIAVQ
jgi:hypothetical protein